ncbi:MAG: hypothetical protein ACRET8_11610, partial [Burkholderiales bacterium]
MAAAEQKAGNEPTGAERRLTISDLLDWMLEDKLIAVDDAERVKKERRYYRGAQHPLVIIADQKVKSTQPPHKLLSLDKLTEWLARRVGLEYRHIDPLKIDFSAVTEVMSSA